MTEPRLVKTLYAWRVRSGLIGGILSVLLSRSNLYFLLGGIIISIMGLLLRTWACGHIRKEQELTVSGPYRYTRNPLYLGNLILGMGIVVASRSWGALVVFLVYFLLFYPVVIFREKKRLEGFFPIKYEDFSKRVPLFFPSLKPALPANKNRFSWEVYKKNKEYRAIIGTIIFLALITGKMLIF